MHAGKCCERLSIEEALMAAPGRRGSESEKVESGVVKFLDK